MARAGAQQRTFAGNVVPRAEVAVAGEMAAGEMAAAVAAARKDRTS